MLHEDPFVSAGLTILSGIVYGYVGYRLWHRDVAHGVRLPARSFAVWWLALAATTLMGIVTGLLGHFDIVDLRIHLTLTYLDLGMLCVALGSLLYYLVYLFSGKPGAIVPIAGFYTLYFLLLVYYISFSKPIGVEVSGLDASIQYADRIGGVFFGVVLALLVLPQILGGLAYATLWFRVRHPTQRYRIALVSTTIIVWFGSALVGAATGASQRWEYWSLLSRMIGLTASLLLLAAYFPPGWIRKGWGIESVPTIDDVDRAV